MVLETIRTTLELTTETLGHLRLRDFSNANEALGLGNGSDCDSRHSDVILISATTYYQFFIELEQMYPR